MHGTEREGLDGGRLRQACRLWAGVMIVFALTGPLRAAETAASRASERAPARRPHVDHAVMPAGGHGSVPAKCGHCQRSACPQCRLAVGHHHGHAQCQHGLCPAHCPVRPDVFGFYGTKWRKWPGEGVVQASNNEAATPVRPPRAEVPAVDEESLQPNPAEGLPAPAADSEVEPTAATESVEDNEPKAEDSAIEDQAEGVVSRTPWRTFTTDPPRLAVQP
jgi:hypothetical protein